MQAAVIVIGTIVISLSVFYLFMYLLYKVIDLENATSLELDQMPVLIPVPIPTKKQKNPLQKLLAFIFEIRQWELAECWRYQLNEQHELIIPKGFRFDGASIPRIFWAFLSPTGLLLIPGLLHDCGYKYDQVWRINSFSCPEPFMQGAGKETWDQLFMDVGNEVNGVWLVNLIAWLAVKTGGRSAWNKYRKIEMSGNQTLAVN